MPTVRITFSDDLDAALRARLMQAIADAVNEVSAPDAAAKRAEGIAVVAAAGDAGDGAAPPRARATPDPVAAVRGFLDAMSARDLDAAAAFLGEGFVMHFPGAAPMTRLSELVDSARARYRDIAKTHAGFDLCRDGDTIVVWCRGTLSGHWPDGTPFAGIRFVDRFELTGGRIVRQDVWNDLAATKGAP